MWRERKRGEGEREVYPYFNFTLQCCYLVFSLSELSHHGRGGLLIEHYG